MDDPRASGVLFDSLQRSTPIHNPELTVSEKLTMPKNVQAFIYKYGGIGSKEQDATFWKEFRKAANAYANVKAKRICDLEHALAAVTEQRDEARRLAEKYRYLSCDSQEKSDETLLPWEITTTNKQNDDNKTTR